MRLCPRPLSPDAFTLFGIHDAIAHNSEVREATQRLLNIVLPHFTTSVVAGNTGVINAAHLVQTLHTLGVNVRHLGHFRSLLSSSGAPISLPIHCFT